MPICSSCRNKVSFWAVDWGTGRCPDCQWRFQRSEAAAQAARATTQPAGTAPADAAPPAGVMGCLSVFGLLFVLIVFVWPWYLDHRRAWEEDQPFRHAVPISPGNPTAMPSPLQPSPLPPPQGMIPTQENTRRMLERLSHVKVPPNPGPTNPLQPPDLRGTPGIDLGLPGPGPIQKGSRPNSNN
jgi:hypothetical protein